MNFKCFSIFQNALFGENFVLYTCSFVSTSVFG